jgi:hypothetical protein
LRYDQSKEAVVKLTRQVLVALVLGAWAASLAQADARPRGSKHVGNTARHLNEHRPVGAAKGRAPASQGAPLSRNAIGVAPQPAGVGPGAAARGTGAGANAAGVVKNDAIGVRGGAGALPAAAPAGTGKIAPGARPAAGVHPATPPFSAYGAGISGTGIARPGVAPSTIGGPAKLATGIAGTGMKPKR